MIEVIGVPAGQVFTDVGPQTVLRLDAMLPPPEAGPALDPRVREALRAVLGYADSASIAALRSELARRGITVAAAELAAVMVQLLEP